MFKSLSIDDLYMIGGFTCAGLALIGMAIFAYPWKLPDLEEDEHRDAGIG